MSNSCSHIFKKLAQKFPPHILLVHLNKGEVTIVEAVIYTIFAIFAVYGMYSAARETVLLITNIRGKVHRSDTLCSGCKNCGMCHLAENTEVQSDDDDDDDGEDKDFFCT